MKLAVLATVLGLCLVVNCANIDYEVDNEVANDFDNNDLMEYVPLGVAEGDIDEDFSLLGILYFALMVSLRTLKGVNCSIRHVITTRDAGVDFVNGVKGCNADALKELNTLLNQVQTVIKTSNDIIHLNTNVCNNGALNDAADAKKTTPTNCFFKLFFRIWSLKGQVSKAVQLSKKLSATPGEYGGCAKSAVSDMVSIFTQFPSYVRLCSRLKN